MSFAGSTRFISTYDKKIGALGGGQRGQMLIEAASSEQTDSTSNVVTRDVTCPAIQINARSDHVNGSFNDHKAIRQLAVKKPVQWHRDR